MTRAFAAAVLAAIVLLACSSGGSAGGTPAPPAAGAIRFTADAYRVVEGAGTVTLTAERTGGSAGAVSVEYVTGGDSAVEGVDYAGASGTLAWGDGDATPRTVTLSILDDAAVEAEERFFVDLHAPTGGVSFGTPRTAVVTIADDDGPPAGALHFTASSYSVDEGAGTAIVTVVRAGRSEGAVAVTYATGSGSATPAADYTPVSGTLAWADGDGAPKTFTIPILDDGSPEPYENVALALSAPTGGAALATPGTATLVIRNDDAAISLSAASFATAEGGENVAVYVNRVGTTPTAVTVHCATGGGTATAGADYVPSAITFSWAAGEVSSKMFFVTPLQDGVREGDETVLVTLSSPTGGAVLASPSAAVVTLADDEPPPEGFVAFAADQYEAANYGGSATVTVERQGGTLGPASVAYATVAGGNATEGTDYLPASGTLSWADGEAGPKTFTVAIVDDLVAESADWIALELSAAAGAELGPRRTAQILVREHWTKRPYQPLLSKGASGWDSAAVGSPSVVRLGPTEYVMYYEGSDPGSSASRIGRATSTDGVVWIKDPATPVLDAGPPGAFDEGGVRWPAAVFDGTTWHLWYAGGDGLTGARIGYATSPDGIAWTRANGGEPVLSGEAGAWDRSGVGMPTVVLDGGGFELWYVGDYLEVAIGHATSPDGVAWTRSGASPVLRPGSGGAWDMFGAWEPTVVKDGDTYRMWYEGYLSSSRIGYATSADGRAWTKYPGNPVLLPNGGYWDEGGVGAPSAVKSGETFQLWYRGAGWGEPPAIGRATLP